MAKRELVGHQDCPECGRSGAEVKVAKSGLVYRWCPDCNAQYFPRTVEASDRLRRAMVPVTVTGADQGPEPAEIPVTVTGADQGLLKGEKPVPVTGRLMPSRGNFEMGL